VFIARRINQALGTAIGPWDVGQLDDALIAVIDQTIQFTHQQQPIPTAPEIARRKAEIRAAYWRRLGQPPPL
jgi:hypothetical protein